MARGPELGWKLENTDERIFNVHDPSWCGYPCPVHRPSEHHMRSWRQHWDGALMRLCPHGIFHPDPDETTIVGHTCDGCCTPPPRVPSEAEVSAAVQRLDRILEDLGR